jgi:replicative DNA helicase
MKDLLPPHNATAETIVIASILDANVCLDRVEECLTEADFYDRINGAVYETCRTQIRSGQTANYITVWEALKGHEGVVKQGGEDWLAGLLEYATVPFEAADMARIVAEASQKRRAMAAARDLLAAIDGDLMGALSEHEAALDKVRASMTGRAEITDLADAGLSGLLDREARLARKTPTGIPAIDRNLIGLERGAVTVLAARPSMGKTAMGTALAVNMARAGRTLGYFSLEMPKSAIGLRAGSAMCFSRVNPSTSPRYFEIEQGKAPEHHEAAVSAALSQPFVRRVFVDDRGGLRPQQLSATFRAWENRARRMGAERPSVVIVDHIGHVVPDRPTGNATADMGAVSKALLAFAKRHDVAVLALSQINRASATEARRPGLHDLRQSGEIEEDAHAVLFLHREEYYARAAVENAKNEEEYTKAQARLDAVTGKAEIIIAKNRNGPVTTVTIGCDLPCNAFWELEGVTQLRRAAG